MIKVLHIFYNSYPNISGASTRNRDIVESQKKTEQILPIALTAPFQPPYREKVERINGVIYIRTSPKVGDLTISENKSSLLLRLRKALKIITFIFTSLQLARRLKPDILHAHSMFFCGITAFLLSRLLRIPYIYEVRSLWEERNYAKDESILGRLQYNIVLSLENFSMRKADRLVLINKNLKSEILGRGVVNEDNIEIVNNAVNFDNIRGHINSTYNIKPFEKIVFGYIGTIAPIEGLIYLLEAFKLLKNFGITNELLIYGDGKEKPVLENFLKTNELPNVKIMGSIKPSDIYKAYEAIDVIVIPRINEKITNQVTPLKPLEAMAYKKLVMVSDVGGLLELVSDMNTGIVFQSDSAKSILNAINKLKEENPEKINEIVHNGYYYIKTKKSWSSNALVYKNMYNNLIT